MSGKQREKQQRICENLYKKIQIRVGPLVLLQFIIIIIRKLWEYKVRHCLSDPRSTTHNRKLQVMVMKKSDKIAVLSKITKFLWQFISLMALFWHHSQLKQKGCKYYGFQINSKSLKFVKIFLDFLKFVIIKCPLNSLQRERRACLEKSNIIPALLKGFVRPLNSSSCQPGGREKGKAHVQFNPALISLE